MIHKLLGVFFVFLCLHSPANSADRPNILLITADDLGLQLGCYGEKRLRTPHLDALAASGIRFENGYVAQSSCSASRAALLTGRWPHQNRNIGHAHLGFRLQSGEVTLPALLRQAGWFTGIFGKLHVEPESLAPFQWKPGRPAGATGYDVRWHEQSAREFFAEAKRRPGPFFLYANYFDPHGPYAEKINQVNGLPEQPLKADDIASPLPFTKVKRVNMATTATFLNCVSRLDSGIGLLMRALEETGQRRNTLVIFIGDNGPPGINGKTSSYEYGVRVPFLLSWPAQIAAGQTRSALVSTLDIMPTLLQATGVPPGPRPLAGQPLQPLFTSAEADWRKFLFTEMNFHDARMYKPQRSVRGERWKLVANLDPTDSEKPPLELYDLSADPGEKNNRINDPAAAQPQAWLHSQLRKWQEATGDPLLDPRKQKEWSALAARWRETAPRSKGPYPKAGAIPNGEEPLLWK